MNYKKYITVVGLVVVLFGLVIGGRLIRTPYNPNLQEFSPNGNTLIPSQKENFLSKLFNEEKNVLHQNTASNLTPVKAPVTKNVLPPGINVPIKTVPTLEKITPQETSKDKSNEPLSDIIPDDITGTKYDPQSTTVILTIKWPPPETRNKTIFDALPLKSQEAVLRSPIPVLVPSDLELAALTQVFSDWGSNTVYISQPDITFGISATKVAETLPHLQSLHPPTEKIRGVPARMGTSEDILWYITWDEFCAGYILNVECRDIENDPRCNDFTYIRALAESLVFVGGKNDEKPSASLESTIGK